MLRLFVLFGFCVDVLTAVQLLIDIFPHPREDKKKRKKIVATCRVPGLLLQYNTAAGGCYMFNCTYIQQ